MLIDAKCSTGYRDSTRTFFSTSKIAISVCEPVPSGARVVFNPTITLRHSGGVSMRKNVKIATRAYRESQLYYWRKHRGVFWQRWVYWGLWLRGLTPRQLAL